MARMTYLEFEKPVSQLEEQIHELQGMPQDQVKSDVQAELGRLQRKRNKVLKEIYSKLTPWEVSLVARHPMRPYTMDYINTIFTDFHELHGDRAFADDPSIVGGLARFNGRSAMVIGHQKGRDTKERAARNFGMSRPEGYRKALRLMKLAEKYSIPIFTFVDTPGAYPGVGAEERGQSEAIGRNLYEMSKLRTPIITTIIGEGGSGGALAVAVCDHLIMLQYSTYSVISPEGCASILWKSASKASEAAQALGLTADRLHELGIADKVVPEPVGGAHRDPEATAVSLKKALNEAQRNIKRMSIDDLLAARYQRLMSYGKFKVGR